MMGITKSVKNGKEEKERQRKAFFLDANHEYGLTNKQYDQLSEREKVEIVKSLRYIRNMIALDRSKYKNFKRYMLERPIYFEDAFRCKCTPQNIRREYMELKRKGYGGDYIEDPEPTQFARIGTEGCYWRSRKTA